MRRFILAASLLLCTVPTIAANAPVSDPSAVSLAQQSVAALTSGTAVNDVTLNANVILSLGSDNESGTGTFAAKGIGESRVDLNLNSGTRTEVRNLANGTPGGAWAKNGAAAVAYSQHNCWTDAAWFAPALSSLTQTSNPSFVFKYIGQKQHGGVNTQHIRVFQVASGAKLFQHLSTVDFYLDPVSFLPVAVAFQVHPDSDAGTDMGAEVRFGNYRPVNGVQVPFHVQRMLNGSVLLNVTVTSAVVNAGLPDSTFNLQ